MSDKQVDIETLPWYPAWREWATQNHRGSVYFVRDAFVDGFEAGSAALAARLAEAERERDTAQASLTMLRQAIDSLGFPDEEAGYQDEAKQLVTAQATIARLTKALEAIADKEQYVDLDSDSGEECLIWHKIPPWEIAQKALALPAPEASDER